MVAEKEMENKMAMSFQFRHKPIPPEVLIPRYQTIIESENARRAAVRDNCIKIT